MANLPYVTATGNISRALEGIAAAATPERVSGDFVKTILKIPGGSGDQINSFLKKIGFTNPDGTPSSIYKSFRNSATRGSAAAASLKFGYAPLYVRNEYMHQLSDEKLKGLIIEETGQSEDSSVAGLVLASIKAIKKYADFSSRSTSGDVVESGAVSSSFSQEQQSLSGHPAIRSQSQSVGMNLAYTINLNLPATSDIAVFNAIFKSLRENLLQDGDA